MASQADYFKVKRKQEEEESKKRSTAATTAAEAPTARTAAERRGQGTPEDVERTKAREAAAKATGVSNLQEAEANKGAYAGLGLGERSQADRMVRSGEAKTRDEAAAMIRKRKMKKKQPSAGTQAGALEN